MEISIPGTEDLTSYPPEAVQVRNTFIHVTSPGQLAGTSAKPPPDQLFTSECLTQGPAMVSCPARQVGKFRELWQDEDSQSASSSSKMVICLEDSLFPTMPGMALQNKLESSRLRDRFGSRLWIGLRRIFMWECKPCAFMYAKGCKNGALCAFCHLCDRTEKKRRQKAKKMMYAGA
eukprot:symbB.v1.2.010781.t1/scaffold707.1/size170859/2